MFALILGLNLVLIIILVLSIHLYKYNNTTKTSSNKSNSGKDNISNIVDNIIQDNINNDYREEVSSSTSDDSMPSSQEIANIVDDIVIDDIPSSSKNNSINSSSSSSKNNSINSSSSNTSDASSQEITDIADVIVDDTIYVDMKDLEFSNSDTNKFTFKKMLETDPNDWNALDGYGEYVNEGYIDFSDNTLTLDNINVTGTWKRISLDENIKNININNVTLPNNSIGSNAFYRCESLASITIPNSVTSIGNSAFYHCTSLTSITIPNPITSINKFAFDYCTSLATVIIDARNSSFDTLEYASFPKELQYIITTGNTMNNYLIGKCLSNDNNIDIPSDDTYYEFEVEYTSNVNTRRIKSISDINN